MNLDTLDYIVIKEDFNERAKGGKKGSKGGKGKGGKSKGKSK